MNEKKENKIAVYKDFNGNEVKLSIEIINNYVSKNNIAITPKEAMAFIMLCKARKLNPFTGEVHLIKYSATSPASMVVGKDAFVQRANAHPDYSGMSAGIVVNSNNNLVKREGAIVLNGEKLIGGWAKVYRKSFEHPILSEVSLDEYMGVNKEGRPNSTWAKMGATMIRKVALVQALREAFPEQLGGMYDSSEMSQSNSNIDIVEHVEKAEPMPSPINSEDDPFGGEGDKVSDEEFAL